jgi:hypothetical protein
MQNNPNCIDAVVHAVYSHKEELARVQSLRKPELQQYLQENQYYIHVYTTIKCYLAVAWWFLT